MNDICNALLTFLNDCATDNEQKVMISVLPTRSEHKQMATEILNKILLKHPEWLPTVVSLAAYPIQVWARESRSGLSLNPAVLIQMVISAAVRVDPVNNSFFCICTQRQDRKQQKESRNQVCLEKSFHEIISPRRFVGTFFLNYPTGTPILYPQTLPSCA